MSISSTPEQLFNTLLSDRSTLQNDWVRFAEVTLPYIFLEDTMTPNSRQVQQTFNSIGATGINTLINRLMLVMFNPTVAFTKLTMSPEKEAAVKQRLQLDDITAILALGENQIVEQLAEKGVRPVLFELLKTCAIIGNGCLHTPKDSDSMRTIPFGNVVVSRTRSGRVARAAIKECLGFKELTTKVQELLKQRSKEGEKIADKDELEQYTLIEYVGGGNYKVTQQIADVLLPEEFSYTYNDKQPVFSFPTWTLPAGHHYGVGLVEEVFGDLYAMDIFSEAMFDGANVASAYRWLVDPAGQTDPEAFKNTVNGDTIPGSDKDIRLVTATGVGQNLQIIQQINEAYERRFASVTLLTSNLIRNAERVTQEEIRQIVEQLDMTLGGVYTRMAKDVQYPVAVWLFRHTPGYNADITPTIITGVDALGRSAVVNNIMQLAQALNMLYTLAPQTVASLNMPNVKRALAAGYRVDITQYLNTEDQYTAALNAMQTAQTQNAATQLAAQNAVQGATAQQPQ